ncbi:MAG: hypothetical protein OEM89_02390 [Nitrosopumilus sp.]|nr:hypothetical protein [Nitrosopumilus sp.]
MIEASTAFILGSLGIALVPTAHSVWRETRFVEKDQMILGGVASILFFIVYVSDPNFPTHLEYLQYWALPIFITFGIISIIVGIKVRNNRERWWTLFLSKRQFGALGIAFLYPLLFDELPPKIIQTWNLPNVIDFSIVLLVTVNIMSLIILGIRRGRRR